MSKKKILLGLLIAAGAAYVVCKALKSRVEVKTADENADVDANAAEQKDVEKQPVDIEEVVAYVTQSADEAAVAPVATDATVSTDVAAADAAPVAAEEDFVEDENA